MLLKEFLELIKEHNIPEDAELLINKLENKGKKKAGSAELIDTSKIFGKKEP